MISSDDFASAVEIIPGRFYFAWLKRPESLRSSHVGASSITFCVDDTLVSAVLRLALRHGAPL